MKNDFLKKTSFALAAFTAIGLCASCGRIGKTATGESDSQARPTETGGFSWTSSESENDDAEIEMRREASDFAWRIEDGTLYIGSSAFSGTAWFDKWCISERSPTNGRAKCRKTARLR